MTKPDTEDHILCGSTHMQFQKGKSVETGSRLAVAKGMGEVGGRAVIAGGWGDENFLKLTVARVAHIYEYTQSH